jgi:hypothetical protein
MAIGMPCGGLQYFLELQRQLRNLKNQEKNEHVYRVKCLFYRHVNNIFKDMSMIPIDLYKPSPKVCSHLCSQGPKFMFSKEFA